MSQHTTTSDERAIAILNGKVTEVIEPGSNWPSPFLIKPIYVYIPTTPRISHVQIAEIYFKNRTKLEPYIQQIQNETGSVTAVFVNGALHELIADAKPRYYWNDLHDIKTMVFVPDETYEAPKHVAKKLSECQYGSDLIRKVVTAPYYTSIIHVDNVMLNPVTSGTNYFWNIENSIAVTTEDTRLQTMEITGQESITQDKVTIRFNASIEFKIKDIKKLVSTIQFYRETLRSEAQFILRKKLESLTLDQSLSDKNTINENLAGELADKFDSKAIEIKSLRIKDIILPGEMREIFNQVVQADKLAQANLIRRREETAATRSLLNTARLMENNPTLLRLKELETLENIIEKVDSIQVTDGISSLTDMVKIKKD